MLRKFILLVCFIFVQFIAYSQLAVYDFTNPVNSTAVVAQPANATFNNFTRVTATYNTGASVFNSKGWNLTSLIDLTQYYVEYSIQANAGYQVLIQSIDFFQRRSNKAPNTLVVAISKDNFASVFDSGTYTVMGGLGTTINWDCNDLISDVSGTITVRFYGYGTTAVDGTISDALGTIRLDNVATYGQIKPATAIPISNCGIVVAFFAILLIGIKKSQII